jgi:hypothetical protein
MYREVTMLEVTEVLRLWREGVPTQRLRRPARTRSEDRPAVSPRAAQPTPAAGYGNAPGVAAVTCARIAVSAMA